MKLLRLRSIRANLAALVAVCLLPIVFAAAGILAFYYLQERSQLFDQTLISARALKSSVDSELAAVQTILEVLATSPTLQSQNPDLAAFHAQASKVLALSGINNVVLISPQGQLMNTARPFGEALPNAGLGSGNAVQVFSTGQPSVTGLSMGPVLKRFAFGVAVPVHSGDAVKYVLLGIVLPDRLQAIIKKASLPEDWIAAIYDKYAIVAARSRTPERFLGKSVSPDLAAALKLANEGTQEFVTLDGIAVFSAFSRSASSGWGVAIGIPTQILTRDLRRSLWQLAVAIALLLAAGLGLAWAQGGRIAGAVRALLPVAAKLERGEAVLLPELPIQEVDEVATAITKASEVLIQTGQALTASEARMRGVLESAMDAIISVDEAQRIVLYNAAAERIFGWPQNDVMGKPLEMLMPERFRAGHAAHVGRFSATGITSRSMGGGGLIYGQRASGEEFPLEAAISQLETSEGKIFSVILRDVTARVHANAALERSNLDLQQFAYIASHDLRTPLRAIAGFVQILEISHADKLDDKALSLIHRTAVAVKRLQQLTEDLLSYARVNSEFRPFAPVNCGEMLVEVIHLLDAAIGDSGAKVTCGALPEIVGDRTQLVQLFLNLIGNGIKYCADQAPVIQVSARRTERAWEFSVTDNGIGIDAPQHEKIFEVFTRLHTQQAYSGTGIGLAVCRRVVERHGGKIWLTSTPGEGSSFFFTIPDSS